MGKRPHAAGFNRGCVVPFTKGCSAVTVLGQHSGQGRGDAWNSPDVTIPISRHFGNNPIAHAMVIAPSHECCAGRGTECGSVETVVTDKRSKNARGAPSFSAANEGTCQLLQYMDYCNSAQSFFRDHFHLNDFREPRGFLNYRA